MTNDRPDNGPVSVAALEELLSGLGAAGDDPLRDLARLAAVQRLVLDVPEAEALVGDLVREAAELLQAETAMLNVVLDDAQVTVAEHGLTGWMAEVRGAPAEWALCPATVRTGRPYVRPDTAAAPELDGNPLVHVDGIRAYAGVPLTTRDGLVLGALCVVGSAPRPFDPAHLAVLERLADAAVARLEARAARPAVQGSST